MTLPKWKTLAKKEILKAHVCRFFKIERQSPLSGKKGDFDVLEVPRWVNILALTENNEVILVKQYRQGTDEITLEIPGGVVNQDEEFAAAAKRELREETGHATDEWESLGVVDVNPAFMTNSCAMYLAKNAKEVGELQLDPLEEIEVVKIPLEEVYRMIDVGEIRHSLVVLTLSLYRAKNV